MKKYLSASVILIILFSQCSKKDPDTGSASNNLNNKNVGASANDFLSASKYNSINVQLQYMPGYAPDAGALTTLTDFLNMFINKPGGIHIVSTQIAASGKSVVALADITALEKQ